MSKKQLSKVSVNLGFPLQYINSGMVNRFSIERADTFTLASFGLLAPSGLLSRFCFVFPHHTLELQKENLVLYSERIGPPKKQIPEWSPPQMFRASNDSVANAMDLSVIDYLHVSHWADAHAEICFWNYSQGYVSDLVRTNKNHTLQPWGVAMLRCEIDLQRAFLMKLYEGME